MKQVGRASFDDTKWSRSVIRLHAAVTGRDNDIIVAIVVVVVIAVDLDCDDVHHQCLDPQVIPRCERRDLEICIKNSDVPFREGE